MSQRPSKRPKLNERGDDDYVPGNIVEIELHNFMTYDHLKCKPGSRLNLVIGPNGSGKSSIVCAIALGLAGEPQLLGRATSVGAYVKRGEDSGYIKISLRGDIVEQKIVITRKIDTQNRSEWSLDGVTVPKRDVLQIIRKFNIQVNNLTQFLPQDRVCEFAKLTPIQLLEETEKAVDNPELPVQHQALIEKSKVVKDLEMAVKRNKDTLDQLKALNAEQEKDVERVRQREDLLAKVELMKKKLPWLRFDMKKSEYIEAKKQEAEAKKKLDEAAKVLKNLEGPIEEQKKVKEKYESACKKVNSQMNQNTKKRLEVFDMESKLVVQARGKCAEMEELKKQEESRKQRITRAKEDLLSAEMELADLPIYEPPTHEIERLSAQILDLRFNANQVGSERKEKENILLQKQLSLKQCTDRLKEMENKSNKLLHALRNSGAERIIEAYKWLQEHRGQLKKDVFGPVLLDVNVHNSDHATFLENHVPKYIWKSFITQDSADRDFLFRNLKSFDVPILNYVENNGICRGPFQLSHEMRELGIYSRLDQVFDAPDAVKEVLISQASLDQSYIGSRDTDQRADQVSRLGILDLWTPESHYRWSVSRYGGHISATVEPIFPSRLFTSSVDVGDVEKLKSRKLELEDSITELEEKMKALQTRQRQLGDEEAMLRKQQDQITQTALLEKRKRRDLERLVEQRRLKFESINKEEGLDVSMQKLVDEAVKLNLKRSEMAAKIKTSLVEAVALKWNYAVEHMMSIEIDGKVKEMQADLKQHEKCALLEASNFDNRRKEAELVKHQLNEAKRHAESVAIITEELSQEFCKMPGTIEELEAAIEESLAEASSILFLNQNVLKEYEERKNKIHDLTVKLDVDSHELNRSLSEVDEIKKSWLPALRSLVSRINDTFSRNFQEMAVAGEVSLDEHDMNFHEYGILIKVKFRSCISDSGIRIICNAFPETLSRLLLALCPNITSNGIQLAATQLPLLELMDCGMTIHNSGFPCEGPGKIILGRIAGTVGNTHQNAFNRSQQSVNRKLIIKHGHLRKLSLWGCSGLVALCWNCPELYDLNLNLCTNLHPERLLLRCPNLKNVHASGCQDMLIGAIRNQEDHIDSRVFG